jgi:basic membrane protein A and related proteins|tara:strand:+ start:620 stop:1657 length:1038 start_codon:yes stop_codon:yes gene_type:complete
MNFLKYYLAITISLFLIALPVLAGTNLTSKEQVKVGFIYVGPVGDHGWTYMHDKGRLMVEEKFGDKVKTIYVESVPEGPDAVRIMREMAESGTDIIFTTSFGYMDATLKVAKEYPDVMFEHATGYKTADNVSVYSSKFYEGRYIQGVIAGLMSKEGKAGYIASFPIPEVIRGINSFYLGATKINPNFDIDVVWVNTWYDPAKEAQAAEVLINQGADIITQHTDSPAPLQTAAKHNIKGFGQASDMIAFAPDTQLTAIMDDWGPYYIARVQAIMDGTWESSDTWGGMNTGMVGMADYTNMPDSVKKLAVSIQHDITEGVFKPFGTASIGELLGMSSYIEGIDAAKP